MKRGIELGINVIVVMAIAILTLVVLVSFFLGTFGESSGKVSDAARDITTDEDIADIGDRADETKDQFLQTQGAALGLNTPIQYEGLL